MQQTTISANLRLGRGFAGLTNFFCCPGLRRNVDARRPNMKAKLTLIASVLLLMSNTAGAQESKAPTTGAQEQEAPTARMTGQDMMGHMGGGMRVMFVLMDTDGDGALSLEEFQTAHAKIFKVIDANKDGKVTPEEMELFMSGGSPTSHQ
jgi:hypothetical protein